MNNRGAAGEKSAEDFLKNKGYKIVERNFSVPMGEVDIVAVKDGLIVFAEVKARSYSAFGGAAAAVTSAKQKRLALAAAAWLKRAKEKKIKYEGARFDVITVTGSEIEHIENAFIPKRATI